MAYVEQTWTTGDIITAEKLNHIESGIDGVDDAIGAILTYLFIVKTYTCEDESVDANAEYTITGTELSVSTPEGYTPVAVLRATVNNSNLTIRGINGSNTGSNALLMGKNLTGSSVTFNGSVTILYVKTLSIKAS